MSDPSPSDQPPSDQSGAEEPPVKKPDTSGAKTAPSLVLVNTGHGKGKSSAAFGVVVRAVAMDWKVAVVQFLKSGDWQVGEEKVCRRLGVEWYAAGDGFTWDADDLDESRATARGAWELATRLLADDSYRLLVLDEISYAMTWDWIDTDEVAEAVRGRTERLSVILTGRDMPEAIIEVADTATEMTSIKHAFDQGIVAKKGIDY